MDRSPILRRLAVIMVALAAVVMVSCSDDDNPSGPGNGDPGPNTINISGNDFTPSGKTVSVGTTIRWINKDMVAHTVTSDNGGFTSSGNLGYNATYQVTFNTPGTFPYHCALHTNMEDTITVVP